MSDQDQIVSLYEDPASGLERHWDADVARAPAVPTGASLSGPGPRFSSPLPVKPIAARVGPQAQRKYTDAELKALGEAMLASQGVQTAGLMGQGASVGRAEGPAPITYDYAKNTATRRPTTPGLLETKNLETRAKQLMTSDDPYGPGLMAAQPQRSVAEQYLNYVRGG